MKNLKKQTKEQSQHQIKWIRLICVSLGLNLINIKLVWAKPVTYDFTVNVVKGSLKGNSYNGFFTYDDEQLTGKETETINAQDGLKVCMNFFNQTYDETKDVDYPEFPALTLKKGIPETLDFWMESPQRSIWWNRNGWEVEISRREDSTNETDCSNVTAER